MDITLFKRESNKAYIDKTAVEMLNNNIKYTYLEDIDLFIIKERPNDFIDNIIKLIPTENTDIVLDGVEVVSTQRTGSYDDPMDVTIKKDKPIKGGFTYLIKDTKNTIPRLILEIEIDHNQRYAEEVYMLCIRGVLDNTIDYFISNVMSYIKSVLVESPTLNSNDNVSILSANSSGCEFITIGKGGIKLERENYAEDILHHYDYICSQIKDRNPMGRISIIQGEPGSGKTYLLRGLIHDNPTADFIFLQPSQLELATSPSFAYELTDRSSDNRPMIFLIEDADSLLTPRDDYNNNLISTMLNLADGILGQTLDIKIIATTNAPIENFDKAITRPGRMCTKFSVNALSIDKANKIFNRLMKTDLPDKYIQDKDSLLLSEIYDAFYIESKHKNIKERDNSSKERKIGF